MPRSNIGIKDRVSLSPKVEKRSQRSEPSQMGRIWTDEVRETGFLDKELSFEMKAPRRECTGLKFRNYEGAG